MTAESKSMMKMKNPRFESMWKMMEESNLGVDDNIESEYLCIICKNILIDACSAPCGCRYCRTCITDYLRDETKICPGDSEYCQNEMINIDCDIHVDQTINTRICRLIVKCPNIGCQTKVDIKSMENHLKICEHCFVPCPLFNIGCADNRVPRCKVNEHLLSEVHSHAKLLLEWVNISRNETELLKIDINQLKSQNVTLLEKDEVQFNKVDQLENQYRLKETQFQETLENLGSENLRRTENIIRDLHEIEKKNSSQIEKLIQQMAQLKNENKSLKSQNVAFLEKNEAQFKKVSQLENQYQMTETRFQETLENFRCENNILKANLRGTEIIVRDLHEIEKKNSSQIAKLIQEMAELRNENKSLKSGLENEHKLEQEASNLELRKIVEKQIQEIDQLKREHNVKVTALNEKLETQQKKSNSMEIKLKEISLSTATIKRKSNETVKSIEVIQESINLLNYGDFVWKIDGWIEKQRQAKCGYNEVIFSKSFFAFKNSYKMCLAAYPDGIGSGEGTHLSIFFYIMKGPNDEILQWPFKHDLEISLINQKTGLVQYSSSIDYSDKPEFTDVFIKPINEENRGFGQPKFFKLDQISSVPGLRKNNQIVIKCSIKHSSNDPNFKPICRYWNQ